MIEIIKNHKICLTLKVFYVSWMVESGFDLPEEMHFLLEKRIGGVPVLCSSRRAKGLFTAVVKFSKTYFMMINFNICTFLIYFIKKLKWIN